MDGGTRSTAWRPADDTGRRCPAQENEIDVFTIAAIVGALRAGEKPIDADPSGSRR